MRTEGTVRPPSGGGGGAGGGTVRPAPTLTLHCRLARLCPSLASVSLDSADPSSASTKQAVAVETCECPWGYRGTSCEVSMFVGLKNIWAVENLF